MCPVIAIQKFPSLRSCFCMSFMNSFKVFSPSGCDKSAFPETNSVSDLISRLIGSFIPS